MGRTTCCVPGCFSTSSAGKKSFFKIGRKYRDITAWKQFCNMESLVDSGLVCEDHFLNKDFINPLNKSQGLHRYVLPQLRNGHSANLPENDEPMDFENCRHNYVLSDDNFTHSGDFLEVAGEIQISASNSLELPAISVCNVKSQSPTKIYNDHDYPHDSIRCFLKAEKLDEQHEEITRLKMELRKKSRIICKQKGTIRNLRTELKKLNGAFSQEKKNTMVDPILLEIQANKLRKRGGARYSDAIKNFALILQYCSKKAYKQMRQCLSLPSISTLRNWLGRINVQEGFSTTILSLLRIKAKSLPEEEKIVSIFFDEMAIAERISYFANAQPDYFTGFPTKLPGAYSVNTDVRAKSVLVLMVKSLRSGFKQAIGYFFCHDLKSNDLKIIINEAISLVFDVGLVPKVLVCDQNSVNRALFQNEYMITEQNPYFVKSINEKDHRIYCMYDAAHLYKSTRNNLLKHNAVYNDEVCSFEDVVKLYWEDIQNTPRTVPNLSFNHINLSQFSEMNVGLAAQTLSWSVAVGIRAYVHTQKLPKAALATALYCEDFDKLFDCANSSNFNSKKAYMRPLQTDSVHWNFLERMKLLLKSMRFINKACSNISEERNFKTLPKHSRVPHFIEGWILYISVLDQLFREINANNKFAFLRTRNLSQDCLEHFFSVIRWKNGNNNHPDASFFSSAYKSLVINHLILPDKVGNVQADLSNYIVNREELSKIQIVRPIHKRPEYADQFSEKAIDENETCNMNELANIHYTTGWVCSKLIHKACIERVTSQEGEPDDSQADSSFLTQLKKYRATSRLVMPGEKILNYFEGVCKIFDAHFMALLSLDPKGVKQELIDIIQALFEFPSIINYEMLVENCPEVCIEEHQKLIMDVLCEPCALKITGKYINMLIACKIGVMNSSFQSEKIMKRKTKKHAKAKKMNIIKLSTLSTTNDA